MRSSCGPEISRGIFTALGSERCALGSPDDLQLLTYRDLAQRVRSHLGQGHRYAHVVRVARCAERLAKMHRIDTRKARLAGMLHDLARLYSMERLISECEMRQMTIDSFERANPIVLHARLGALLAQETFGVHDPAVLSAIEKHTVGAAAMSPLDCVVYLADGLEPGRDFSGRDRLWRIAERDLDRAMHATLTSTVGYLTKQGLPVAPQTKAAVECFAALTQEVSPSPN